MNSNAQINPTRLFAECFVLYAISLAATFVNNISVNSSFSNLTFAGVLVSLMILPFVWRKFINKRSSEIAGTEIFLSGRDAAWGVAIAAILIPWVLFGAWIWLSCLGTMTFAPSWDHFSQLEAPLPELLVTQILLVAMPEEFFYRGYLMTTLRDALGRQFHWTQRKTDLVVLILTSLLFASAHTLSGDFMRLNTFFPGLLFGYLRLKSEGILGCILLHAACNMMMQCILVQFV